MKWKILRTSYFALVFSSMLIIFLTVNQYNTTDVKQQQVKQIYENGNDICKYATSPVADLNNSTFLADRMAVNIEQPLPFVKCGVGGLLAPNIDHFSGDSKSFLSSDYVGPAN